MWLTYIYNGVEGAVAAREEQWWWLGRTVMMVERWSLRSTTFRVDDLLSGIFRPYKSNSRRVLFNYTLPKINLNSMQERPVGTGCNRSLSVLNIWKCRWTVDRTAVFGLDRSWEFPVSIGLGPVRSRSFSCLLTGPSNTICSSYIKCQDQFSISTTKWWMGGWHWEDEGKEEAVNALLHHTASLALVGCLFPCHSCRTVPSIISAVDIYIYTRVSTFPCLAVRSNPGSNAGEVGDATRWNLATRQRARGLELF